ncbi:MAG: excinuclease ABC subunit UvrA [Verrucomicrobiae bacterium]|nr:excinuclease ABC subunit UvrA [Verrucomicrobiae bacterium]
MALLGFVVRVCFLAKRCLIQAVKNGTGEFLRVRGARQNNLKGFDLDLPLGRMTVVTGLSGSGKSSLVFDTLYAEGQRRYVETFSPYARQFLERLDPPRVASLEGIPPAIAVQQGNTVKTSRSTVGTLTELCDYFKLLMPHCARPICPGCGREARAETPADAWESLRGRGGEEALVCFDVPLASDPAARPLADALRKQGFRRAWHAGKAVELEALPAHGLGGALRIVQDRLKLTPSEKSRFLESAEAAQRAGGGRFVVLHADGCFERAFSLALRCDACARAFPTPRPAFFSFNNPLGACPACRGFGRTMEIDMAKVLPDATRSLREGAIAPWRSGVSAESQDDLLAWCRRRGVDPDRPFARLKERHRRWILDGDPDDPGDTGYGPWYGVRGYFRWLESKSYKMHMRVLLSRYRIYRDCAACGGGRFQPETLNFKLGGKSLADLYGMPVGGLRAFLDLEVPRGLRPGDPIGVVREEILGRLRLLGEVGLDYLTLNRAARTLSGGEVQRVHLIACLGTAMVNTLFILDEPSVGLHARDVRRLIGVLHALRDQGNTVVVVEHDASVIRAGDHLVELGPGAGENGGRLERSLPMAAALDGGVREGESLTLDYVRGVRAIPLPARRRRVDAATPRVRVRGARENNLRGITVDFPLGRLVCVTGVSGSGKSTLVHRVLHANARFLRGDSSEAPGACDGIEGLDQAGEVCLVDQSPLARTARSSPALYTGAWEGLRELLAATPEAQRAGFSSSAFSFNAGEGRCGRCSGSGHEKIEMQFLPDVWIQCPVCRGKQFREDVLGVRFAGWNAAEWLGATVSAAAARLADAPLSGGDVKAARWRAAARKPLLRLDEVGLGYLRLGQPLGVLSGGEAQRLKLCGAMRERTAGSIRSTGRGAATASGKGESGAGKGDLILLDEPTTGLHVEDVRKLIGVLQRLVDAGNTVVVIEHQLDFIASADWVVDLGPEAGEGGGHLVVCGPPERVAACEASHTGRALREQTRIGIPSPAVSGEESPASRVLARPPAGSEPFRGVCASGGNSAIRVLHAREHNLKNLSIEIPRDRLVVLTGPSGSGKSTLAFDLIFAEGQRRFLDCVSAYARQYVEQMPRGDVDRVDGLPPTVAIEQRMTRGGWKSTVATVTEAYHFLRLLYAKAGVQHCPDCGGAVRERDEDAAIADVLARARRLGSARLLAPVVRARKGFHEEVLVRAAKRKIARARVDGVFRDIGELLAKRALGRYREHTIDLDCGATAGGREDAARVRAALRMGGGALKLAPEGKKGGGAEEVVSMHRACGACGRSFAALDPRDFSFNSPAGWCPTCFGYGVVWRGETLDNLRGEEEAERDQRLERRRMEDEEAADCPDCRGARLKRDALAVRVGGATPADLAGMSGRAAAAWLRRLRFSGRERLVARDLVPRILERLHFLDEVGLGYLGLGRAAVTLSGGESQRIRLAAQLGSNLRGVLYVLDEPTIGLHPRDNARLLGILDRLKRRRNSLLVVEHDEETMRRADWLVDLGPGAGHRGGEVVWEGEPPRPTADGGRRPTKKSRAARMSAASRTLEFLNNPMRHPMRGARRPLRDVAWIEVTKAAFHNLRGVAARFPVGRLIAVTGVSGAGKSSLVRGVLLPGLQGWLPPSRGVVRGRELLASAYEVDQSPIGKTPRSCPATYLGVWDEIRRLFAATPEARRHGYGPGRFSFNVAGGRCERCEGQGRVKLEMSFLPEAHLPCEVCGGARFNPETREVRYREKNVAEVLAMGVDEAAEFFGFDRLVAEPLKLLAETGLGYVALGQSSPTLSGGEAQRLKLVSELMRGQGWGARGATMRRPGKGNLYVLEEPTIGLHFADVEKLMGVLHRLVEAGHTVVVIEHHLDVIAEADYVLDLGPEGGEGGGRVLAWGTPEDVARGKASHTAPFLRRALRRSSEAFRISCGTSSSSNCGASA